jgi:Family of unknown function (DUF5996)
MTGHGGEQIPAWPRFRLADWADVRDTLHMWTQIIGKIRMQWHRRVGDDAADAC